MRRFAVVAIALLAVLGAAAANPTAVWQITKAFSNDQIGPTVLHNAVFFFDRTGGSIANFSGMPPILSRLTAFGDEETGGGTLLYTNDDGLAAVAVDATGQMSQKWVLKYWQNKRKGIAFSDSYTYVSDGIAFAVAAQDHVHVYAVYVANGTVAWRKEYAAAPAFSAVAAANGTAYVSIGGVGIVALDAKTGAHRWTSSRECAAIGDGPQLRVLGDKVYVNVGKGPTDKATMCILNTRDGSQHGRIITGLPYLRVQGNPQSDGAYVFSLDAAKFQRLDNGTLWLGSGNTSPPMQRNGWTFTCTDTALVVLNATTGAQLAKLELAPHAISGHTDIAVSCTDDAYRVCNLAIVTHKNVFGVRVHFF